MTVEDLKARWIADQRELIDEDYRRIHARLARTLLYGRPMNCDDPKQLMVAAWHLATQDATDKHLRELERHDLRDLERQAAYRPRCLCCQLREAFQWLFAGV